MSGPTQPRRRRTRHLVHRPAQRLWWSLTAAVLLLGVGGVIATDAGAAKPAATQEGSDATIVVDRVDATGDEVIVSGSVVGADVKSLRLSSDGDEIAVTGAAGVAGSGVKNEVVAVIDNAASLGNATVQLAKDGLAPLMPGEGAVSELGIVSTGGTAAVQAGPTSSVAAVQAGLDGIAPSGASATWQGLMKAAELLEDRDADAVGTIVLFAASPSAIGGTGPSAAESAMQRAGVRLEVVALPMGADMSTLSEMVADLGGSVNLVENDEQLAGAYDDIAAELGGRFALSFVDAGEASTLVPLTVSSGDTTTQVSYTPDSVRTGSVGLAPVVQTGNSSLGILTSPLIKVLIVLLGVAAIVMLGWVVVSVVVPDGNDLTRRLEVYEESYGVEVPEEYSGPGESHTTVPIIQRAVEFTGDMAERRGMLDKVEEKLERANLPLRAPEALFFSAVGSVMLTLLSFFLTKNILMALIVAVLSIVVPVAVLNFKIARRQKAFVAQLPDMLTLLAGTLRAGYSIGQGFESCSEEVADPMGRELKRVVSETRLGRSLEESLESVAERMDSDDFSWAVMAIKIQREVGGNLAELLLTVADTMTQRERLRRDVSTLTAEGRMSAVIIGLLPPGLGLVMFVMNPEYIKTLFESGLGNMLIAGALVMMGIGFAWMKKTITIEV